jgi:hypothetical protein
MISQHQTSLFISQIEQDSFTAPILGVLISWSLPGLEIQRNEFNQLVAQVGLGTALPRTPSLRSSLRRSLTGEADLVRTLVDEDSRLVLALVDENVDQHQEHVSYSMITTASIEDGQVKINDPNLEVKVKSRVQHHQQHLHTPEVTRFYLRTVRDVQGIPVRDRGGLYFLPRHYMHVVDALRVLTQNLSLTKPECSFSAFGILDAEEYRRDMKKHYQEDMEQTLQALKEDLEQLALEGNPRPDVVRRRFERYKEVEAKATAYADLLKFRATESLKSIRFLKEQLIEVIKA